MEIVSKYKESKKHQKMINDLKYKDCNASLNVAKMVRCCIGSAPRFKKCLP